MKPTPFEHVLLTALEDIDRANMQRDHIRVGYLTRGLQMLVLQSAVGSYTEELRRAHAAGTLTTGGAA